MVDRILKEASATFNDVINEVATVSALLAAAVEHCRRAEPPDEALQALLEKAGYLTDRILEKNGDPGACGDFDAWMGEEKDEAQPAAGDRHAR